MTTYTQDGVAVDDLSPVTITQGMLPTGDAMQSVTVQGHFDWQFWLGVAVAVAGGYVLLESMGHAARLPTRRRPSRRLR